MQHLQPNTILQGGKYIIERVLGQGGFGITYMATQVLLQRKVAIKELFLGGSGQAINDRRGNEVIVTNSANQASFDQQKAKFNKEASRLANLNHPNLVKVHELFSENGTVYYVMDYIDGETLRTKLNRDGKLSEALILKYMQQLLSALDVAHKKNIWHLDIKPENIMVDQGDHVYLIDFGASKHIEHDKSLTTSLALAYTPGYCPPELTDLIYESQEGIIEALKEIGSWTDIYELGATIYNLLTNSNPPSSKSIDRNGNSAFSFPDDISSSMRDIIVWMMKPRKEDRPKDADVLEKRLKVEQDTNGKVIEKPTKKIQSAIKQQIASFTKHFNATSIKSLIMPFVKQMKISYIQQVIMRHLKLTITIVFFSLFILMVFMYSGYERNRTPEELYLKGELFYYGNGVPQDFNEAMKWYLKAAEKGEDNAMRMIGYMYAHGEGVTHDNLKALQWYQKAADLGNAHAMSQIGYMYETGQGVTKSDHDAIIWYKRAAEHGNSVGMYYLGSMYLNGDGVAQNDSKAFRLIKEAAEKGYPDAMNSMGYLYEDGIGVTANKKEAIAWYKKAARKGNYRAKKNLERLGEE